MGKIRKESDRMFSFITCTENPLGGECPGKCSYCWAQGEKGIAKRYQHEKYQGPPRLYEKYFSKRFKEGDFVFVSDMRDLFSPDVPDKYISKILRWIEESPEAEFLLLSKWPVRYLYLLEEIPGNAVIGATVETNRQVFSNVSRASPMFHRWEAMQYVAEHSDHRTFLSMEPIMDFDLEACVCASEKIRPWKVAVGYDNYDNKLDEPELAKTESLIERFERFTDVERKTIRKAWWEK